MEVQLNAVDARRTIEKTKNHETYKQFEFIRSLLGSQLVQQNVDEAFVSIAGEKLRENLPGVIAEKLKEKADIDIDIIQCSKSELGEVLLTTVIEAKQD